MGLISCSLGKLSNNVFYGFSSVKCGTSGILPVSRREQNEVDDFSKSTSRLKSTNRDSSNEFSSFRIEVGRSFHQPGMVNKKCSGKQFCAFL